MAVTKQAFSERECEARNLIQSWTVTGLCLFFLQGMAVFEQFVMGMLTNFDSGLPLDRIHNMLKMFVVDPPYDKSSEQLEAFLRQLASEEKVAIEGGLYKKRN